MFLSLNRKIKKKVVMGNLGPTEIILIVLVLILLFGGKKIPELMKGIGDGIRQFKKGMNEEDKNKDSKE
jgi:sec-independent protein translocase protein TatA